MQATFLCQNCHHDKPINPCLQGEQSFCNLAACQRARKRLWHQKAMATDKDYRAQSRLIRDMQKWRKERPLHRYQKHYRENHPEYVKDNRQKQTIRNRRQQTQTQASAKIVKMDALVFAFLIADIAHSFG